MVAAYGWVEQRQEFGARPRRGPDHGDAAESGAAATGVVTVPPRTGPTWLRRIFGVHAHPSSAALPGAPKRGSPGTWWPARAAPGPAQAPTALGPTHWDPSACPGPS